MSTTTTRPMVNDRREIFGWAVYDWANSAFSTTVGTVFLGPYFTELAKSAADASGLVYLFGVPIAPASYLPYAILSRSLYSQMIPQGREAEFFSLYEVSERGTSWLGPLRPSETIGSQRNEFRPH